MLKSCEDAGMAQSVEHVIGNDEVISSILITSSKSSVANATELFRFSAFLLFFVCPRGRARDGSEDVIEITDAPKSAFHRDIGDAFVGLLQQSDGMVDAIFIDKARKVDVISSVEDS